MGSRVLHTALGETFPDRRAEFRIVLSSMLTSRYDRSTKRGALRARRLLRVGEALRR